MTKRVGQIVRLLVAVAGVSFIVLTLTWQDHVVLPAGYELVGGTTVSEPTAFAVIEQKPDTLVIDTSGTGDYPKTAIDRDALGRSAGEPRFKPGVVTTVTRVDWRLVIGALAIMGVVFPIQTWRWLILMRSQQMVVGFGRAFRLTMAGLFFNFCMPGTTGGDVVKAYYTAKNSGQQTTGVMSVLLDRVAGMVGLVLLAALVGLTMLDEPVVGKLTLGLWLGLLGLAAGTGLYLAPGWREALRLHKLRQWLPGGALLAKIDEAAAAYRHHKATVATAVGVSVIVHLCLMTSAALVGKALGLGLPITLLLAVLPLVLLVGALPITFQGIGVMEWLVLQLLYDPAQPELATANQLVGMLLLFRLCMLVYALLGSLVLLKGDIHLFPQKHEATATDAEPEPSEPKPGHAKTADADTSLATSHT